MLNVGMRRRVKALIFLVGAAVTLFAINSFYLANHNPMLEANTKNIDTTQVTPQKLFDKSWQTIKNEYYDPNFNHQRWGHGKTDIKGKSKLKKMPKLL